MEKRRFIQFKLLMFLTNNCGLFKYFVLSAHPYFCRINIFYTHFINNLMLYLGSDCPGEILKIRNNSGCDNNIGEIIHSQN